MRQKQTDAEVLEQRNMSFSYGDIKNFDETRPQTGKRGQMGLHQHFYTTLCKQPKDHYTS
jgi:hypothetical protein